MANRDGAETQPFDVDFVVGPTSQESSDELLDTETPRHAGHRLLIGSIVAALVIVAIVVVTRDSAATHQASPSVPTTHAARSLRPVVPTFPTLSPASPIVIRPLKLTKNLCVTGRVCVRAHTPARVRAAIRAAISQAFGPVTHLAIRNSVVPIDDPPRETLFAREIRATTRRGNILIQAAAVDLGTDLDLPARRGAEGVELQAYTGDYVVAGGVGAAASADFDALAGRLDALLNDVRLVAKS